MNYQIKNNTSFNKYINLEKSTVVSSRHDFDYKMLSNKIRKRSNCLAVNLIVFKLLY